METDKKIAFIGFRDLVLNRANNLLFCFDGTITTLREESSKAFFFKQTFSHMLTIKELRKTMNYNNDNEENAIIKTEHQSLKPISNSVINN